jgi:5-methylcytosine-specific restriction endonuclease McrA/uncharacterized protein YkuJ
VNLHLNQGEHGMAQKHTIEFIRSEFEKEGYTLLSKEYVNNKQKLDYICPENHLESIRWDSWVQGNRCLACGGKKKFTTDFIQAEFEKEGYVLLTLDYINCEQELNYICPDKHKGSITWHSWKNGGRCAECAGNKTLTIEFAVEQFEKEGYTLLSKEYINCEQKLKYRCPKGHDGSISLHNWKRGARCFACYLENNKGKGNPNYNPNLTDEDRLDRRLVPEYNSWRYLVKEKDGFTCQVCGQIGCYLVSHHLESYNNNPDLRTVLGNGVCLCEKCHNDFHSRYGRGNNTRKQFEEFKLCQMGQLNE